MRSAASSRRQSPRQASTKTRAGTSPTRGKRLRPSTIRRSRVRRRRPAPLPRWAADAAAFARISEDMHMTRQRKLVSWSIALGSAMAFLAGSSALAPLQAVSGPVAPDATQGRGGAGGGQGRGGGGQAPRPYGEVITAAAKTDDGIFK